MKSLLVLDPCPQSRLVLKPFLGEQGYELVFAANAAEALNALWEREFSAVLIDTTDPSTKGEELLGTLFAADPQRSQVRIAFTSGGAAEQERLLALGATSCLRKPFDFHDMTAVLSHVVENFELASR